MAPAMKRSYHAPVVLSKTRESDFARVRQRPGRVRPPTPRQAGLARAGLFWQMRSTSIPVGSSPSGHDARHDRGVGGALALAGVIVVAEYAARRGLAPALPIVGAPVVNDMLASAVCYAVVVTFAIPARSRTAEALGSALRAVLARAASWLPWAGAVLFLVSVVALTLADSALWGAVRLPVVTAPPSDVVVAAGAAQPLSILALVLVNGLMIPLAEERLWRGIVQPRLVLAWGPVPALAVTAALFSAKHAIVDGSLGRLLALALGGLVLGLVAYRAGHGDARQDGWQASAVSHVVGNLVATSVAIAAGMA